MTSSCYAGSETKSGIPGVPGGPPRRYPRSPSMPGATDFLAQAFSFDELAASTYPESSVDLIIIVGR
jgi:hypothetical protein